MTSKKQHISCGECNRDVAAIDHSPTGKNAYDSRDHVCWEITCIHCDHKYDLNEHHECYLMPVEIVTDPDKLAKMRGGFVFYDIECMRVEKEDGGYILEPNLLIAQFENGEELIFRGVGCIEEFIDFIFLAEGGLVDRGGKWHVIVHNGSRLDALFLMRCYFEKCTRLPNITWDGCSFKKIPVGNIVILDSCCFIQTKLENFPKMFV